MKKWKSLELVSIYIERGISRENVRGFVKEDLAKAYGGS